MDQFFSLGLLLACFYKNKNLLNKNLTIFQIACLAFVRFLNVLHS